MNEYDGLNKLGDNAGGFAAGRGADVEPDVSEFARRLRMNAQHLAKFLEEQYERLDSAARQCEQVLADRQALDNAKAELRQQMREWEASRTKREEEIRQEQDRLIAAWKSIETQQRKVLAGISPTSNGASVHPLVSPAQAIRPQPTQPQPQPAQQQPNPPSPAQQQPASVPTVQPPPLPAAEPYCPDPSMPILETDTIVFNAAAASSNQVFVEPTVARPVSSPSISREAALDQFQRLKREIRSHSQRSRQPNHD